MPTRHASATWEGGLRGGTGSYSGESGTLGGKYAFATRFGEEKGSNPEELLAAAEAACFSMALSGKLEGRGTPATRISTSAACTVEKVNDAFTVTTMKLTVRGVVPGISPEDFQEVAAATKDTCPISRAIKGNVQIHLDAALE
jgi:lipoyl-dependent peroxiredoxin